MMRTTKLMSVTELGRLYENADVADWPNSDSVTPGTFCKAFLCCAYFTGLRLGDLLALTWEYIREDRIRMRSAKTNRVVVLPHHPVLCAHLEPMRGSDGELVFPIPPESRPLIREQLERIGDAADIPRVTLRSIRRLSATAYETAQLGSGSLLLGHAPNSSSIDVAELLTEACNALKYPEAFEAGATIEAT